MKNKKSLFIFILVVLSLVFVGCTTSSTDDGISKVELVNTYFPSEVVVGTFDASNCKVRVYYTDGTSSVELCQISDADLALFDEVGLHTITVKYLDHTLSYNVLVTEKPAEKEPMDYINDAIASIDIPSEVSMNFSVPSLLKGVSIKWKSDSSYITISGRNATVVRPDLGLGNATVKLTATLSYAGVSKDVEYNIVVLESTIKLPTPEEIIAAAKTKITVLSEVTSDFSVLTSAEGVSISWNSSNSDYLIVNNGVVKVIRPTEENVIVTLTATFTYLGVTDTDTYQVVVLKKTQVESGYKGTYYDDIDLDAVKSVLKTALRSLITDTHKKITSYDDLKTVLPKSDASLNSSGKMVLFYTGIEVAAKYDSSYWNREHVWPKSLGWFSTSGAGSDAHHIRPTDTSVNSARGNKKFAELSSGSIVYTNSTNGRVDSGCIQSGNYFEPRAEVKGDIARIIFYMMIRYTNADSYNLTSVAQSAKILLDWNELDPVDDWEMNRNNVLEGIQGNRNPFIDHPSLANVLFG